MKELIQILNTLFHAVTGRGPVHRAAVRIIQQRIATAEKHYADQIREAERAVAAGIAELKTRLEDHKAVMLDAHVQQVFKG